MVSYIKLLPLIFSCSALLAPSGPLFKKASLTFDENQLSVIAWVNIYVCIATYTHTVDLIINIQNDRS